VNHDTSVTAKVEVPALDCPKNFDANGRIDVPLLASSLFPVDNASSSIVGWEPNERGKAGPRIADLRASLDTRVLMTQAVDLNLRLMKWRQWPELQLEKLRNQRCLLMGSGTLGCAVARALMGWGIRHITFVDNGRVAYSNPVRQSLFAYEDAKQGKFKAVAAAEQVMRIFPDMTATAELLAIPMPGHAYRVTHEAASSATDCLTDELARARLDQLVQNHDVVFNLTDSREARWFPTLLASTYGKPCINAALGFDSYVVSHNGITSADGAGVGCYFCTDIVAAGNSQRDRTLDEQCTVTRPGLSFIAGALCAELLVALLHDTETTASKGAVLANEDSDATDIHYESSASSVPHQIRGSVLGFAQMCLESSKFPFCTACSSSIVDAYRESPAEFVAHVSQDPKHLETLSGISEMVRDIDVHLCIDSDEDF
jgi:ubiquitin-like modifier-activating enzyme ATG7